jgi:hypothetical protein
MSNQEANLLDALEGLLEERRRYEGWIAQLEDRRSQSPSHVVDRVRGDYQARLDGVTAVLRGRMADLESSAASLVARITELEHEESQRRDERAETELRALVGEFAPDLAHESIARSDESLAGLASERAVHSSELSRVNEILALVRPQPKAAVAQVGHVERAALAAAHPDERTSTTLPANRQEAEALHSMPAPQADTFSHMADAESVGEMPAAKYNQVAPSVPVMVDRQRAEQGAKPASDQQAVKSPLADELAFLHSVVDSRDAPTHHGREDGGVATEPRAPSTQGGDLLPQPVLTAPSRPGTPVASPSVAPRENFGNTGNRGPSLTPGSIPAFLKDMPTEQVKTLKCSECGTMNYPTEWYCERCGGELAAM